MLGTPDLMANLISLSQIDAMGGNIHVKHSTMKILGCGGQLLMTSQMGTNNPETLVHLSKSEIGHDPRALA